MPSIKQLQSRTARLIRLAATSSLRAERRRRRAFDELFRPVESGTVVIDVPELGGAFEMDCRSHILRRLLVEGSYEPDVAAAVKQWIDPARDAIDVGANVGFFAVLMSRLVAPNRVLAVEPTPGAFVHLSRNIGRNSCENVILFQGVAASRPGQFAINIIEGMEEYSTIAKMVHPSIAGMEPIETHVVGETIDNLVERYGLRPGFLKIDTEGAEHEVLAGCARTLQTHRPVVLCEAWADALLAKAGAPLHAVTELLECHRYNLSRLDGEILAVPR
jgi:FkbM family methyltransferase